jgi:hypothetical protein
MITNTGKDIIAKYLIGQAPAYASYIAVGCGAKPLSSDGVLGDYSDKKNLDFEMFRVPIISRGYVNEDDISKVVFTAELPSEERYEITEVGVYSAGSNPAVGAYDSKTLYAFNNEAWEYHSVNPAQAIAIPTIYEPLDGDFKDNGIHDEAGYPAEGKPVFQTNADNRIFADITRTARYERCRFLNNIIVMSGDSSTLTLSGGHLSPDENSNHIHLIGANLSLNQNAPNDELRLAFSVINKSVEDPDPDTVKILLEFASTDVHNEAGSQFARFEVVLENGTGPGQQDFSTNRYVVSKKQLQELYKSNGFTWSTVDVVKIYASVEVDGVPSENYYVCLDALRLQNLSTANPLYGLTGYSVIRNKDSQTIVKAANTTNFIEFRFAMDVQ